MVPGLKGLYINALTSTPYLSGKTHLHRGGAELDSAGFLWLRVSISLWILCGKTRDFVAVAVNVVDCILGIWEREEIYAIKKFLKQRTLISHMTSFTLTMEFFCSVLTLGAAAEIAADRKTSKYTAILPSYCFLPLAFFQRQIVYFNAVTSIICTHCNRGKTEEY